MKRYHYTIPAMIIAFLLTMSQQAPAAVPAGEGMDGTAVSVKAAEFRTAMRKLWEDHITWTRLYIISAISNLPDKDATAQRLLRNQDDIGNAVASFYGGAAGTALATLLKTHITTAGELIAAAAAHDQVKQADATKRWYKNADEIAEFLSGANPNNWPAPEMKSMMHDHLNLTTTEVVARLQGNWKDDVAAYDKIHAQILGMADMLSRGIEAQFPDKF